MEKLYNIKELEGVVFKSALSRVKFRLNYKSYINRRFVEKMLDIVSKVTDGTFIDYRLPRFKHLRILPTDIQKDGFNNKGRYKESINKIIEALEQELNNFSPDIRIMVLWVLDRLKKEKELNNQWRILSLLEEAMKDAIRDFNDDNKNKDILLLSAEVNNCKFDDKGELIEDDVKWIY